MRRKYITRPESSTKVNFGNNVVIPVNAASGKVLFKGLVGKKKNAPVNPKAPPVISVVILSDMIIHYAACDNDRNYATYLITNPYPNEDGTPGTPKTFDENLQWIVDQNPPFAYEAGTTLNLSGFGLKGIKFVIGAVYVAEGISYTYSKSGPERSANYGICKISILSKEEGVESLLNLAIEKRTFDLQRDLVRIGINYTPAPVPAFLYGKIVLESDEEPLDPLVPQVYFSTAPENNIDFFRFQKEDKSYVCALTGGKDGNITLENQVTVKQMINGIPSKICVLTKLYQSNGLDLLQLNMYTMGYYIMPYFEGDYFCLSDSQKSQKINQLEMNDYVGCLASNSSIIPDLRKMLPNCGFKFDNWNSAETLKTWVESRLKPGSPQDILKNSFNWPTSKPHDYPLAHPWTHPFLAAINIFAGTAMTANIKKMFTDSVASGESDLYVVVNHKLSEEKWNKVHAATTDEEKMKMLMDKEIYQDDKCIDIAAFVMPKDPNVLPKNIMTGNVAPEVKRMKVDEN